MLRSVSCHRGECELSWLRSVCCRVGLRFHRLGGGDDGVVETVLSCFAMRSDRFVTGDWCCCLSPLNGSLTIDHHTLLAM